MRSLSSLVVPIALSLSSVSPAWCLEEPKPNFLFTLVDDLGYMDIGANNPNTFYETPKVNRLAR